MAGGFEAGRSIRSFSPSRRCQLSVERESFSILLLYQH